MSTAGKLDNLDVWVNAKELVLRIYDFTATAPVCRDFGYCDQIRRAATSIMSNIAEGFGRSSDKEFALFLDMARGSGLETRSLLHVGVAVSYLDVREFTELFEASDHVVAQITALRQYLRAHPRK